MFEPDDVLVPTATDLDRVRLPRYPRAAMWVPDNFLEDREGAYGV